MGKSYDFSDFYDFLWFLGALQKLAGWGGSFLMVLETTLAGWVSDFISVCLETRWLGQKQWFLCAGTTLQCSSVRTWQLLELGLDHSMLDHSILLSSSTVSIFLSWLLSPSFCLDAPKPSTFSLLLSSFPLSFACSIPWSMPYTPPHSLTSFLLIHSLPSSSFSLTHILPPPSFFPSHELHLCTCHCSILSAPASRRIRPTRSAAHAGARMRWIEDEIHRCID